MTVSTIVKTLGLVLSLGFDTIAVAVGLGISGLTRRDRDCSNTVGTISVGREAVQRLTNWLVLAHWPQVAVTLGVPLTRFANAMFYRTNAYVY
jgi:hypothetical protein